MLGHHVPAPPRSLRDLHHHSLALVAPVFLAARRRASTSSPMSVSQSSRGPSLGTEVRTQAANIGSKAHAANTAHGRQRCLGMGASENGADLAHLEGFQQAVSWRALPTRPVAVQARPSPARAKTSAPLVTPTRYYQRHVRQRRAQPKATAECVADLRTAGRLYNAAQSRALRAHVALAVECRRCKMHQYLTTTGVHTKVCGVSSRHCIIPRARHAQTFKRRRRRNSLSLLASGMAADASPRAVTSASLYPQTGPSRALAAPPDSHAMLFRVTSSLGSHNCAPKL
ncbi:hypothetical protein SVAN01_08933 [Stagonosporopsis vannaccii]|nr:hypothetical protein SVAN01_08933 [Stagonosporopsis vannaccii]